MDIKSFFSKLHLLFYTFFLTQMMFAQLDKSYSVAFSNLELKDVFIAIEDNSNFSFYFDEHTLDKKTYSKNYSNQSIHFILKDLLQATSVNYFIRDNDIIITNNSIIRRNLPINYFKERKDEVAKVIKNTPIFQKQFISENKGNYIIIGKESSDNSDSKHKVYGYVRDQETGRPIADLLVYIKGSSVKTTTDKNGYYLLKAPTGLNVFETKVIGFDAIKKSVIVYGEGKLDFIIKESTERLDEVIVTSKKNDFIKEAVVGITNIDIKGIKTIPLVLGDRDILKIATTMPGVKTAGEGSYGFNVRGGKADQNLILLDNAIIYNPSHLFGMFSAINPFTTGSVNLYKGSISADHGGRLSSVIDMESKSVNKKEFSGEGSISPITGNLVLEIPLKEDKVGLLTGFRMTYSDWLLKSITKSEPIKSHANFLDAILRYDHAIGDKTSLKATAYYSNDAFSIASDSTYKYSNRIASLELKHAFNTKNKASFQLYNSQYQFNIINDGNYTDNFDFGFNINETQFKTLFTKTINSKHKIDYGLSSKLYIINPGEINPLDANSDVLFRKQAQEKGLESALFISDKFKINDKFLLDLGIRYSYYLSLGEGIQNVYDPNYPLSEETILETREYGNYEKIKSYGNPEVRASIRYAINPDISIKAAYNNTVQYIHMMSSNTTASPVDSWKLSNLNIAPQKSDQYSLGLFSYFKDKTYEFSLEGYYKKMKDILDFKVGAELLLNENLETELLQGEGEAYGAEILLKKKKGKLNGWIGYSYSRSLMKLDSEFLVDRVNDGAYFPTNHDRPHDLNVIANYKLTKRYSFSMNFVYQTGRPITYPVGRYTYAGIEQVLYSDRNQYRIPDYYRFDFGINIEGNHKVKKLAHSFWNISVYNVFGRNNPYSIYFVNEDGEIKAYKTLIFSVPIPTITYNFKF